MSWPRSGFRAGGVSALLALLALGGGGCDDAGVQERGGDGASARLRDGGPLRADAATAEPAEPAADPSLRPWPAFPADEAAAQRLIAERTTTTTTTTSPGTGPAAAVAPPLDAARLAVIIREAVAGGTAIAGEDAVGAWLRDRLGAPRDVVLLFGVFHDAGPQLDWIRRLLGPAHQPEPVAIAAELFRADGRWAGVAAAEQAGDDELLTRYARAGDRQAYAALRDRQRAHDYTAWKYGFIPQALDLAQQARASGGALLGCDVPVGLAPRLAAFGEATRLRVRELHCALHLLDARLGSPWRVALIWGDDHLSAEGVRRFLPASAEVTAVHLVGGRASDAGIEAALAREVRVADPLLVPVGEHELALLVPAPPLGARVDRRRDELDGPLAPAERGQVTVSSTEPGRLVWPSGAASVTTRAPAAFALTPGEHAVLWQSRGPAIVLALRMPRAGAVELDVSADALSTLQRVPAESDAAGP